MKRLLLALVVALLLAGAGCLDTTGDDPADEFETPIVDDADTDPPDEDASADDSTPTPTPDDTPPDNAGDDTQSPETAVEGELELHHIDVGQADSTLIVTPENETILIDTGDWRPAGEGVIAYLEDLGIDRIDHLVATHGHADHIGGHAAIIEHFEEENNGIGAIYDSGVPHDSQTYENYLDAVEEYDHELLIVEEGDELPLDSEDVEVLVLNPPDGESGDDLHYNSVALRITFGEFSYLTTGDAEEDAEQRMVEEWSDELTVDVYQAGHHGSSTSSTPSFLDEVDPEIAVISSNLDSQYGHPHDEVLETFDEHGIETYWTGVHGDIVITTDGNSIETTPEQAFSTDPLDHLAKKHEAESSLGFKDPSAGIDTAQARIPG
jgi:competence protein ComEC